MKYITHRTAFNSYEISRKYIHSHDYKDPEAYNGRRVLVVGVGPSGEDLAIQLQNTAVKVLHSHHRNHRPLNFNNNYITKPDVKTFVSNGVIFTDGTFEEVDDVIFCTGFRFSHPFLDKSTEVLSSEKFVLPLYQNIVNILHPSMMFIGITYTSILRTLEAQAEYAASLISRKFKLPSQEQMMKMWLHHTYDSLDKNNEIFDFNNVEPLGDQYHETLTVEAGITRIPPVLIKMNFKFYLQDPLNFRHYKFEVLNSKDYIRWYDGGGNRTLECLLNI